MVFILKKKHYFPLIKIKILKLIIEKLKICIHLRKDKTIMIVLFNKVSDNEL